MPFSTRRPNTPNSGPRWSIVGRLIARRIRSGTGLGPGICRKWRPVGWKSRSSMIASCAGPRFLHCPPRPPHGVCPSRGRSPGRRVQESAEDEAPMLIDRAERLAAAAAAPKGTRPAANEVAAALDRRLSRETEGEVRFDAPSRGRYATDASIYQIMPVGVLVPKSGRDIATALEIARDLKVPVLPRGGGTSQCGQAIGAALVIDNSKYFRRMCALDVESRTVVVEPGLVLDHL